MNASEKERTRETLRDSAHPRRVSAQERAHRAVGQTAVSALHVPQPHLRARIGVARRNTKERQ
eukprot:5157786-Pleurochrysis_carterae.AAC.1